MKYFGDSIYTHEVNKVPAEEDQRTHSNNIIEFNNKSRSRSQEDKEKNKY